MSRGSGGRKAAGATAASLTPEELARDLKQAAAEQGFCLAGIAPAVAPGGYGHLRDWIDAGYAGEMHYLPRREAAYGHPSAALESVRSILMLAMTFRSEDRAPSAPGSGQVSCYAWNERDYHDLLRERLRPVADRLHQHRPGCRTRITVDTAPILERDFARLAGLGWFGKNTMLLNKRHGSFFFLAGLLTDVELPPDAPHESAHCGTCTRCLDACPTDAFVAPYVLDARRCISYLTIELRDDPVPLDLRAGMQDWMFGCDICQDVCPWNTKAPRTRDAAFTPRDELRPVDARRILELTPEEFDHSFGKTPLARPGRAGVLRNAAIVVGNQRDAAAAPALIRLLDDEEPLIRGAAAWALTQTGGNGVRGALETRRTIETDPAVLAELDVACQSPLN